MKKWVIELLLFTLYLVFGLCWLAYAPLSGQLEEAFQIQHAESGMLIVSAVSLANAFGPIFAGWLGSRIGLYRSIGLGASLCALAAVNPWIVWFPGAVCVRFLFGLGGGIIATLMAPMTMRWFAPGAWANLNGFNNVAVNVGITMAMFFTLPLSYRFGWRPVLSGYGAAAAVVAALWWLCASEGGDNSPTAALEIKLSTILRRRETWYFTLGFAGPLASYLALNSWLGQHLQAHGLCETEAAQVVGILNLAGLPAAPLGGWFTTWLGRRRPPVIACGLLLPPLSLALLWAPHPYLWASLLGAAFLFYLAAFFTIPMELPGATPQSVGLMMGAILSLSYLLTCGSPIMVGWLSDHYGPDGCLTGLAIFGLLSGSLALCGKLLPETGSTP